MNSKSTIPNHEDIPLWFEFRYGLCLLEIGNSAEAIRQFQRLTRRNPDNSVYWECLGLFSKIEPKFDWLSIEAFIDRFENPSKAESYVERGSLNTALKSYQE